MPRNYDTEKEKAEMANFEKLQKEDEELADITRQMLIRPSNYRFQEIEFIQICLAWCHRLLLVKREQFRQTRRYIGSADLRDLSTYASGAARVTMEARQYFLIHRVLFELETHEQFLMEKLATLLGEKVEWMDETGSQSIDMYGRSNTNTASTNVSLHNNDDHTYENANFQPNVSTQEYEEVELQENVNEIQVSEELYIQVGDEIDVEAQIEQQDSKTRMGFKRNCFSSIVNSMRSFLGKKN